MFRTRLVVILLMSILAWPAISQQKPDFSGRWIFSKEKSHLGAALAAGVERGVVRIDHREPNFTFDRTFVINGKDSRATYTLTTDGKAVEKVDGRRKESSRMYWEGDILVLSERLVGPLGEGTNVVHYQLLEGGRILVARERTTGPQPYENEWVFEKAGPNGSSRGEEGLAAPELDPPGSSSRVRE